MQLTEDQKQNVINRFIEYNDDESRYDDLCEMHSKTNYVDRIGLYLINPITCDDVYCNLTEAEQYYKKNYIKLAMIDRHDATSVDNSHILGYNKYDIILDDERKTVHSFFITLDQLKEKLNADSSDDKVKHEN